MEVIAQVRIEQARDWGEAKAWWGRHTPAERMRVWRVIQGDPESVRGASDTEIELLTRFAQLGFTELVLRPDTESANLRERHGLS